MTSNESEHSDTGVTSAPTPRDEFPYSSNFQLIVALSVAFGVLLIIIIIAVIVCVVKACRKRRTRPREEIATISNDGADSNQNRHAMPAAGAEGRDPPNYEDEFTFPSLEKSAKMLTSRVCFLYTIVPILFVLQTYNSLWTKLMWLNIDFLHYQYMLIFASHLVSFIIDLKQALSSWRNFLCHCIGLHVCMNETSWIHLLGLPNASFIMYLVPRYSLFFEALFLDRSLLNCFISSMS